MGLFFQADHRQKGTCLGRVTIDGNAAGWRTQEETRRLNIEVLYRRGGKGGIAQAWEIDHAAGLVRLVPQMADSEVAKRKARA